MINLGLSEIGSLEMRVTTSIYFVMLSFALSTVRACGVLHWAVEKQSHVAVIAMSWGRGPFQLSIASSAFA
jgi:hypothetical protein